MTKCECREEGSRYIVECNLKCECICHELQHEIDYLKNKMKECRSLLWSWAPMFCDHAMDCAWKDGVSECDCNWEKHCKPEKERFLKAIKDE